MEGNKDEADKCISLAQKYMKENNRDKAEKFLHKAERLYPTQKAKDLLLQLNFLAPKASAPQTEQPHRRKNVQKPEEPAPPEYTSEQAEAVKRIKGCKDYYEMLGVSKDATDSDIKKCYKKLALQLHPDKNKYPGAAEAFKVVGNAFTVLTDLERRKHYDQFGPDEERVSRSYQRNTASYSRGFESEATAEELFNMFFGGGFNGVYVRRGGRWQRHNNANANAHETHNHTREQQQSTYSAFVQILPIILAILLSMASSFMVSDPAYSLQHSSKYPLLRRTHKLDIPYYVKENFATEYQGSVKRLEYSVEEEYMTNLKHACYREKNYRDSLLWKARNFGDKEMYHSAQNMPMQSCQKLQELRNHG